MADGDEPPVRRHRATHADDVATGLRLGLRLRRDGRPPNRGGSRAPPGLSHDHLRLHPLGEVFRRVTGRTVGQYLRTEIAEPVGADVHIGLSDADQRRCAERVNKPHMRDLLTHIPSHPTSLDDHPKAGLAVAMGFAPDDEVSSYDLDLWRRSSSPAPTVRCPRWGWRRSTTRWPQEKLLSREHMDLIRVSQGGFETDLVLGPRVADHGWGLGYMLNQRVRQRAQPADLRPRRAGRLVRIRRPGTPDRLRVCRESLRRHQGQRGPDAAWRRATRSYAALGVEVPDLDITAPCQAMRQARLSCGT